MLSPRPSDSLYILACFAWDDSSDRVNPGATTGADASEFRMTVLDWQGALQARDFNRAYV